MKVVPKWKRDLMERKKDGHKDRSVETSPANKANANAEPPWMRELHERKKRGFSAPVKVSERYKSTPCLV